MLKNPTLDADELRPGDFVEWLLEDRCNTSYAVVTGLTGDRVNFLHYDTGFPWPGTMGLPNGTVKKTSQSMAIEHFVAVSDTFAEGIEKGGLEGAFSARQKYNVDQFLHYLDMGVESQLALQISFMQPLTGVYVVQGVYGGHGPGRHLEGLSSEPIYGEKDLSQILIELKPKGFGNIHEFLSKNEWSDERLIRFTCYEIPKDAISLVENPHILKSSEESYFFTEIFSKKYLKPENTEFL